jgi:hypothetical protein
MIKYAYIFLHFNVRKLLDIKQIWCWVGNFSWNISLGTKVFDRKFSHFALIANRDHLLFSYIPHGSVKYLLDFQKLFRPSKYLLSQLIRLINCFKNNRISFYFWLIAHTFPKTLSYVRWEWLNKLDRSPERLLTTNLFYIYCIPFAR